MVHGYDNHNNMKVPRLPCDAINDVAIFNHSLLSVMN